MATERRTEIQWLRGLAATEVVICHSDLATKHFSDFRFAQADHWYHPFLGIGVEVFFMVSGYVICMRAASHATGGAFFLSRIRRLFPMYWIFTSLVLLALLIDPSWRLNSFEATPASVLQSYLVLPQGRFPILGVGWTLEHEMLFYAVVAVVMLFWNINGRAKTVLPWLLAVLGLIGCLRVVVIAGAGSAPSTQELVTAHIFSPYMLAFGFGWLVRCTEEMSARAAAFSLSLYAAIVAAAYVASSGYGSQLVIRIGEAALIFGAFLACRRLFEAENLAKRLAWRLGDASFSIYLSHWFVLSVLGKLFGILDIPSGASSVVRVVAVGLCVIVGCAVYSSVEKPIDRWLQGRRGGTRAPGLGPGQSLSGQPS